MQPAVIVSSEADTVLSTPAAMAVRPQHITVTLTADEESEQVLLDTLCILTCHGALQWLKGTWRVAPKIEFST